MDNREMEEHRKIMKRLVPDVVQPLKNLKTLATEMQNGFLWGASERGQLERIERHSECLLDALQELRRQSFK
jgi:hypothetical protein